MVKLQIIQKFTFQAYLSSKEKKNAVDNRNGLKGSNGDVKGRQNGVIPNGNVPKKAVNGTAKRSS